MTDVDSGSIDVLDTSYWLERLPRLREREGHLTKDEVEQLTNLCTLWIPELERICTQSNANEFDLELTLLLHAIDVVAPQADQRFLTRMLDSEVWKVDDITSFKAWLFSMMIRNRSDHIFELVMQAVRIGDTGYSPPIAEAARKHGTFFVRSWLFAAISAAYRKPCRFPISADTLERYRSTAFKIKDLDGINLLSDSS
jgi:hypothetical protein